MSWRCSLRNVNFADFKIVGKAPLEGTSGNHLARPSFENRALGEAVWGPVLLSTSE